MHVVPAAGRLVNTPSQVCVIMTTISVVFDIDVVVFAGLCTRAPKARRSDFSSSKCLCGRRIEAAASEQARRDLYWCPRNRHREDSGNGALLFA